MISYTKDGLVNVPEVYLKPDPRYRYEALRGYGHTLAAFDGETCVGYLLAEDLGYADARAWLAAQSASQPGPKEGSRG